MRYSTLVVAASAFAGFASAQNSSFNTPIPCCTVPAIQVNSTLRESWCEANTNTCVDVCGGQSQIASDNGNDCNDDTLEYSCKCSNGTDATSAMTAYQQSVPGQMCRFWYGSCVEASGSNGAARFQCEQARDARCGNLTIDDNGSITTGSATPSGGASRTSGGSGSESGSAGPSQTSTGAAALAQYGAPILAGGFLAVFGIAL
ncbi:hypothetical protein BDU57DRAFT_508147 [Ampelomyces quisqualis]|uniref:DUF7707 domain-containing protein n=1 Tax=Ampelomyces quisqualis TaxID=50730 RepID=A0A6A5QX91_AMPQU|nr:hypothetical protein BDU57DRAFT_508147 [Ampelomyces quisqualis]